MLKILKYTLYTLIGIILLTIIGAVALVMLVDPNNLKGPINQQVQKMTGRQLTINGNINWSFFPWLGLQVHEASLSNAPGFNPKTFAAIQEADVRLKLIPLFWGKLEVGNIKLDGLKVNLIKKTNGASNWQDLTMQTQLQKDKPSKSESSPFPLSGMNIDNIDVQNASVTYTDKQHKQAYTLTKLTLQGRQISLQKPFPLKLAFDFSSATPALAGNIIIKSQVDYKVKQQTLSLDGLQIRMKLTKSSFSKKPVNITVNANSKLDMANESLILKNLNGQFANVKFRGDVNARNILSKARVNATLAVDKFNPKKLLQDLGKSVPQTKTSDALTAVSANAQLYSSPDKVDIKDLRLVLDNSVLTGDVTIADPKKRASTFNLNINRIDFNRYTLAQNNKAQPNKTQPNKTQLGQEASKGSATQGLPLKMLRELNIAGRLQIGSVKFEKLQAANFKMQFKAKNGVIKLSPITAAMYQGQYKGEFLMNVQARTPKYSMMENFSNVQLQPLLGALWTNKRFQVSGISNLYANLTTAGTIKNELMRSLNGVIRFQVSNGVIKGIDIRHQLNVANALFSKQTASEQNNNSGETRFGKLTGSISIIKGIARNNDLLLEAPALQLTGRGDTNLVKSTINYGLQAKTTASQTAVEKRLMKLQNLLGGTIPIRISGTFDNYKIYPDAQVIVKARAKSFVKKQSEKLGAKLNGKLGGFGNILQKQLNTLIK